MVPAVHCARYTFIYTGKKRCKWLARRNSLRQARQTLFMSPLSQSPPAAPALSVSPPPCRMQHTNQHQEGYAWICHSMYPAKPSEVELRATIGGPLVKKPYSAAMLNVSAMSYGALSDNAILALSRWGGGGGVAGMGRAGGPLPRGVVAAWGCAGATGERRLVCWCFSYDVVAAAAAVAAARHLLLLLLPLLAIVHSYALRTNPNRETFRGKPNLNRKRTGITETTVPRRPEASTTTPGRGASRGSTWRAAAPSSGTSAPATSAAVGRTASSTPKSSEKMPPGPTLRCGAARSGPPMLPCCVVFCSAVFRFLAPMRRRCVRRLRFTAHASVWLRVTFGIARQRVPQE